MDTDFFVSILDGLYKRNMLAMLVVDEVTRYHKLKKIQLEKIKFLIFIGTLY